KIVEERNRPSLQKYNLKNTEDLNDSRAKTIGGELGMGMVLAGFVQSSGPSSSTWNFQVRAVSPRDGKVFFSQNYKLREDKTLAALIEVKTPPADPAPAAPVAVPQPAPAPAAPVLPAPVVTPPPAAPVIPKPAPAVTSSKPANGTYTFYPRPQGYQGAAKVNAYLNKIVVRGDYMSIYLTKAAQGPGSAGAPFGNWFVIYVPMNKIVLQDLDNPSKSYTAEQYDYSGEDGPYFTYKGVPARRFSLTNTYEKVPIVFEEIILGDPD
ncbi:MAG: hypothetical protein LBT68_05635, partial [Spirochaetales bacterium]|nr:hypothetical protein [Spirochaetales bacterium]